MRIGNIEFKLLRHKTKKEKIDEKINDLYDRLCRVAVAIDNMNCKVNINNDNLIDKIIFADESSTKLIHNISKDLNNLKRKVNKTEKIKSIKKNMLEYDYKTLKLDEDFKIKTNEKISNIEKVLIDITIAMDRLTKKK